MKAIFLALSLACAMDVTWAQTPAPTQPLSMALPAEGQIHSNDLGFSYQMPADWEVQDTDPMLPVIQQQAAKNATHDQEKKDIGCIKIPLKATHGDPPSTVVVVGLSYDCMGQRFTDADLAAFGGGFANSLRKTWTIDDPVYGAYTLGTHSVWIEHANGTSIAHPETKRALEMVCSMLKKGAVCWMAFMASDADLHTFEQSRASLDGEPAVALVPPSALTKRP